MKTLQALLFFDFSRCRFWLAVWWAVCVAQAVAGRSLILTGELLMGEGTGSLMLGSYVLLVILLGLILLPAHPGRSNSFFRTRPVLPQSLLRSRLFVCVVLVLLPHFLAQVAPLLLLHASVPDFAAFALYYWGAHLGLISLLAVLAAGTLKMSSYLLRVGLTFVILMIVAAGCKHLSLHESNWIPVRSPEAVRILWEFGTSLLAAGFFITLTSLLYRGRRSWKIAAWGIGGALCFVAMVQSIQFITDGVRPGEFVATELLDESLSFRAERSHSFVIQRNKGLGAYSGGVETAPPYDQSDSDAYWFIKGNLEIEGLDPALAYSTRLLEARWIAPSGEVVAYDPPAGTYSVRNSKSSVPPPPPTAARLDTLLGELPPPEAGRSHRIQGAGADVLLFGAWTSVYERFKLAAGRLELRVRVDLYTHDCLHFPLVGTPSIWDTGDLYRLAGYDVEGDELEVRVHKFWVDKQFSRSPEKTWNSGWNWMLFDPKTGGRGRSSGSGSSGSTLWQSFGQQRQDFTYKPGYQLQGQLDLSNPESLELVRILPRYLGSTEVDVVVEDFSLVTQKSIEAAERAQQTER